MKTLQNCRTHPRHSRLSTHLIKPPAYWSLPNFVHMPFKYSAYWWLRESTNSLRLISKQMLFNSTCKNYSLHSIIVVIIKHFVNICIIVYAQYCNILHRHQTSILWAIMNDWGTDAGPSSVERLKVERRALLFSNQSILAFQHTSWVFSHIACYNTDFARISFCSAEIKFFNCCYPNINAV